MNPSELCLSESTAFTTSSRSMELQKAKLQKTDDGQSIGGCYFDNSAMKWIQQSSTYRWAGGYDEPRKLKPVVITRKALLKASRFLRDAMVQKNRQHQLRNEALRWKGKIDYMHGPVVYTTPEQAVKKAEKYCSKRVLKMMEKAEQEAKITKPIFKVVKYSKKDRKVDKETKKKQRHQQFLKDILAFCAEMNKEEDEEVE